MPDQSEILQQLTVPRYAPRIHPTPIPTAAWNDDPLFCLEVNDEWVSHILGVMIALDQPDTWVGTDDEIAAARQQVNEIMAAFMEVCMDCCGQQEIPLTRVDGNGHFQQSTDGGATWEDTPQFDPRNSIPQTPPYPPADSDGAKCAYADSVVQHFKTGFVDVLEEGNTVETVLGFLTGIAEAIFGPLTGPIGWIVPAIFAIATAVVAFGIVAYKAAFNDTVWHNLRCLIFDNINDDGLFSQTQIDNIYGAIDTVASDIIAQTTLRSWIAAIGVTGMGNAAHIGLGNPDNCVCDCTSDIWDIQIWDGNPIGTLIGRGEGYVDVQTASHPDFGGAVFAQIFTDDAAACCTYDHIEILSGDVTVLGTAILNCGEPLWPTTEVHGGSVPVSINTFRVWTTNPTIIRVHFV